jgi:hypothetical protein
MTSQTDQRPNARAREQLLGLVSRPRFEEYREKYKHFKMERRNGILQVQMHTDGGPVIFNPPLHNDWPQLWMDIGNDPGNEVPIFSGAGDKWIGGFDRNLAEQPIHQMPADAFYDHIYWDATKLLEDSSSISMSRRSPASTARAFTPIRSVMRHYLMRRSRGVVRSALRRPGGCSRRR